MNNEEVFSLLTFYTDIQERDGKLYQSYGEKEQNFTELQRKLHLI